MQKTFTARKLQFANDISEIGGVSRQAITRSFLARVRDALKLAGCATGLRFNGSAKSRWVMLDLSEIRFTA
ncbi:MAG: hypothetical protein ACUVXB_13255 [Bryobacteraceae bacterium]